MLDEGNLDITAEGISMKTMDSSKASMLEMKLHAN